MPFLCLLTVETIDYMHPMACLLAVLYLFPHTDVLENRYLTHEGGQKSINLIEHDNDSVTRSVLATENLIGCKNLRFD